MQIILFLVILIVVAGLTAAAGDRMGHRAARRKIRFGKLRPRTVSTLIAVTTGVLISLISFLILFAIWADFREAMLNYRETKQSLMEQEGLLAESQAQLMEAEEATGTAIAERDTARLEADTALADTSAARESLVDLTANLGAMQAELEQANSQLSRIERDIGGLRSERDELVAEIAGLNETAAAAYSAASEALVEAQQAQEASYVVSAGSNLARVHIPAEVATDPQPRIEAALAQIKSDLQQVGVDISQQSLLEALTLIDNYPYAADPQDAIIVISSKYNVKENEEVALIFSVQPVARLVYTGDILMEIIVHEDSARLDMQGAGLRQINVPAEFDYNSLEEFIWEIQQLYVMGLDELGFFPGSNGEFETPVIKLVDVAEDLINRERPFMIQFVAADSATAVDSTADAKVYISTLASGAEGDNDDE